MNYYKADLVKVCLPDISVLSGTNILITGGTGLVGGCLVELLLLNSDEYDFQVYVGCRDIEKGRKRFSEYLHNNRLHFAVLDVICPISYKLTFDYIIHAASNASPNFFVSDPVGTMKSNILGVCNLMDYGKEHGLRRFVYVSSGEIYGEGCKDKWYENDSGYVDSMSIRACYPSSKRSAETLCVAYASQYGIETVVARLCHTFGPYFTEYDNRVYAQFIRNVLSNESIVLKSRGEQYRSWLYVVDAAVAILYILLCGETMQAYNVADEENNITIRQLAEIVSSISGKELVLDLPENNMVSETPIVKATFDTCKLKALGWKAIYNVETGMRHTIYSL